MEEIKYISMKADITFKALWTLGNNEVKKYLIRIIEDVVKHDVNGYDMFSNKLGISNYSSIANRVDILLYNKSKHSTINIELNKEKTSSLIRKNDSYLYKLAGEAYRRDKSSKCDNDTYSHDIDVSQINFNCFNHAENKNIERDSYVLSDSVNNYIKKGITFYNLYQRFMNYSMIKTKKYTRT